MIDAHGNAYETYETIAFGFCLLSLNRLLVLPVFTQARLCTQTCEACRSPALLPSHPTLLRCSMAASLSPTSTYRWTSALIQASAPATTPPSPPPQAGPHFTSLPLITALIETHTGRTAAVTSINVCVCLFFLASGTTPSSPFPSHPESPTFTSCSSSWSDECTICYENVVDAVLYACGHMCLCYTCGLKLKKMANACCPICRRTIKDIIKIYRST